MQITDNLIRTGQMHARTWDVFNIYIIPTLIKRKDRHNKTRIIAAINWCYKIIQLTSSAYMEKQKFSDNFL